MSSIGSGPGVGQGPNVEAATARRIGAAAARPVDNSTPAAPAPRATETMVTTQALDAGTMPVDSERVAQIKKALEENRYPVLPIKIGDALIAAGLLLQVRQ